MASRKKAPPAFAAAAALFAAHAGLASSDARGADEPRPAAASGPVVVDAARGDLDQAVQAITPAADPWRFTFTPYLWAYTFDGDVKQNGRKLPISLNLHDTYELIRDNLDFGFAGHLEAKRGDWSFFLDGDYLKLEFEESASKRIASGIGAAEADVDVATEITFVEVGAARHVGDVSIGDRKLPVEILGGARWNYFSIDPSLRISAVGPRQAFQRQFGSDTSSDWVDPFVGAKTDVALGDRVNLQLRGDVGGGVGAGSDFAWNIIVGLSFQLNPCTDLFLGYRWYDFERDDGGRETHLKIEGPGVGVLFRF